jgi:hypothetical protein
MSQVIADFGVNGVFPSNVGGTGTTVKYFGRNAAYNAGATWTSPATPSATNAKGALIVPGDNKLNGQRFNVSVGFDFTPYAAATSETVTVALYAVTGTLTSPTYTILATTGAYAPGVDGIAYSGYMSVDLFGTNNSGVVGGSATVYVENTSEQSGAITNSLTGIVFGQTSEAPNQVQTSLGGPFGLVVGVTFGASAAQNTANLYQFSISA